MKHHCDLDFFFIPLAIMAKIFDTFSYVIFFSISLYAYLSFCLCIYMATFLFILSIYLSFSLPFYQSMIFMYKHIWFFHFSECFEVIHPSLIIISFPRIWLSVIPDWLCHLGSVHVCLQGFVKFCVLMLLRTASLMR